MKKLFLQMEDRDFYSKKDKKQVFFTAIFVNTQIGGKDYEIRLNPKDKMGEQLIIEQLNQGVYLMLQTEKRTTEIEDSIISYDAFFVEIDLDNEVLEISLKPMESTAKSVLINQLKKVEKE